MTPTLTVQIEALRVLSSRLSSRHLTLSGAIARKSDADELINQLNNAYQTMAKAAREGVLK